MIKSQKITFLKFQFSKFPGPVHSDTARNWRHMVDHNHMLDYNQLRSLIKLFYWNCLLSGYIYLKTNLQNYKCKVAKSLKRLCTSILS